METRDKSRAESRRKNKKPGRQTHAVPATPVSNLFKRARMEEKKPDDHGWVLGKMQDIRRNLGLKEKSCIKGERSRIGRISCAP